MDLLNNLKKNIIHAFSKNQPKKHSFVKYLFLIAIIIGYFIFVSIYFGMKDGLLVTILTWSFFVFCTPIADAGFVLDFPIRLVTGIRMVYSEIAVWIIAIIINLVTILIAPQIYDKTLILSLFKHIIFQPFPYWGIILVSGIGTFISIYFGDELIDVSKHSKREKYHTHLLKYEIIVFIFIIVLSMTLYSFLLNQLGINIPL